MNNNIIQHTILYYIILYYIILSTTPFPGTTTLPKNKYKNICI
jgi:hypothetical protein